jgi:hypothetical protein
MRVAAQGYLTQSMQAPQVATAQGWVAGRMASLQGASLHSLVAALSWRGRLRDVERVDTAVAPEGLRTPGARRATVPQLSPTSYQAGSCAALEPALLPRGAGCGRKGGLGSPQ